jgi:hypothetical protein
VTVLPSPAAVVAVTMISFPWRLKAGSEIRSSGKLVCDCEGTSKD